MLLPSFSVASTETFIRVLSTCTLSVRSADCERSTCLKFPKTCFCSAMQESRVSGLALLLQHRNIPCNIDVVVDEVARRQSRRMKLKGLFSAPDDEYSDESQTDEAVG